MSEFALSINNTSRDLEVQKYPPILTAEQEYDLAIELYENGSLSAAKKLVLAHMRFVAFIAHGYKGYGLENADLIQEGTIGLMKAVKRFNPHKKVRLSSFAVYWIRAEIHEYIFKNWKIVKNNRINEGSQALQSSQKSQIVILCCLLDSCRNS